MKFRAAFAAVALALPAGVFAAGPDYVFVDKSVETLIDESTARSLFREIVSPRLVKLYPPEIWGFTSQVSGGITANGTCVVTARAMLLPRNNPRSTKLLLFKPEKMATAFDAVPGSSAEKCHEVAKGKLREAFQALSSVLAPT